MDNLNTQYTDEVSSDYTENQSKLNIVSQSNDNCLQIQHLFAFLEPKDKSQEIQALSLVEKTITKINF